MQAGGDSGNLLASKLFGEVSYTSLQPVSPSNYQQLPATNSQPVTEHTPIKWNSFLLQFI